MKIIKKKLKQACHCCGKNKKCKLCKGKGIYTDYLYYYVVGKYCYDADTLK
jgi:hypothetical protein